MTTSGVTSTLGSAGSSATATAASQTASSQQQLAANMNTFLELLTAQLQNQDPLNPMDTSQFTNQLVLFAQVQQQIDINQNLETMMSSQNDTALASSANYLGEGVTAVSQTLPLQNSTSTFYYTTPSNSASVQVVVSDSAGNIVDTMTGDATAGTHTATWNGAQVSSSSTAADGNYTLSVTSTGTDGSTTQLDTAVSGTVTAVAVDPTNNAPMVMLGSLGVDLTNIIQIQKSGSTDTNTSGIGTALSNAQSSSNTNTTNTTN
ncbi:MAG TPA: flagellar hook capping FlgD N-terminal domain-containing protein [Magnetospirillaceae bacterium]|jgi:flagellar basal-body rod modification protein FlgD